MQDIKTTHGGHAGGHASKPNTNFCADEILDGVWLGSQGALDELLEVVDIGLVITAITEPELKNYKICERVGGRPWIWIPMEDDEDADIIRFFSSTNTAIDFALAAGKQVLIHCAAGVSRSATLVIAYLMWRSGFPWKEAFDFVRERRSIINPNDAFCDQLDLYEDILRSRPWMPTRRSHMGGSSSKYAAESTD